MNRPRPARQDRPAADTAHTRAARRTARGWAAATAAGAASFAAGLTACAALLWSADLPGAALAAGIAVVLAACRHQILRRTAGPAGPAAPGWVDPVQGVTDAAVVAGALAASTAYGGAGGAVAVLGLTSSGLATGTVCAGRLLWTGTVRAAAARSVPLLAVCVAALTVSAAPGGLLHGAWAVRAVPVLAGLLATLGVAWLTARRTWAWPGVDLPARWSRLAARARSTRPAGRADGSR